MMKKILCWTSVILSIVLLGFIFDIKAKYIALAELQRTEKQLTFQLNAEKQHLILLKSRPLTAQNASQSNTLQDFLNEIIQLARNNAVTLLSVEEAKVSSKKQANLLTLMIKINGSFSGISQFIKDLMPYPLAAKNFKIHHSQNGQLEAVLQLVGFPWSVDRRDYQRVIDMELLRDPFKMGSSLEDVDVKPTPGMGGYISQGNKHWRILLKQNGDAFADTRALSPRYT